MSIADQLSNLSDEDQQRFHDYTQRSLKRRRAKARNQTERKHDEKRRTK